MIDTTEKFSNKFKQMSTRQSERFITPDVFRSMTIFLMIIVNTPGGRAMPYTPLKHAQWNGCTLTDLVFPSFLFAVGSLGSLLFAICFALLCRSIGWLMHKKKIYIRI